MSADAWMALYIGAYLADTMHLARQHHGSYFLLIMAAFKNAGWLPSDDSLLMQIAKCTSKEWKAERAIYAAFFQIGNGRWTHKRVTLEWEKAQRLTEQRRAAGIESAAKRQRNGNGRSTGVGAEPQRNATPSEQQVEGEPLQGSPTSHELKKSSPVAAREAAPAGGHAHDIIASLTKSMKVSQ